MFEFRTIKGALRGTWGRLGFGGRGVVRVWGL